MLVLVADDQNELIGDIKESQNVMACDPELAGPDRHVTEAALVAAEVRIEGVHTCDELRTWISSSASDESSLPDIIFLDLSFKERRNGIEALKFLKYNEDINV